MVIDHDVKIEDANIGPKTEIARGTTIGMKKLSGVTAIGPRCNIGISPNFYNKFWWMRGRSAQDFTPQNLRMREICAGRILSPPFNPCGGERANGCRRVD